MPIITLSPAVRDIMSRFAPRFRCWAVGGCVRDSLLGRSPGDWDLCTDALPEETLSLFPDCRTALTGLRHGTVTVLWQGQPYEITTLRAETGYCDHRHPDAVRFVTELEQDLARRDFTVNAMACGMDGLVVDCFGGQEDLKAGILRCVGDPERRFEEDALRVLRGLRFCAQLGFVMEAETARAAQAHAGQLSHLSAERVYAELNKLLAGQSAAGVLREYPLILAGAIPEITPCVGFDHKKPEFFDADVWEHTVDAFAHEQTGDRLTRWALLLHDLGKPECFTLDEQGGGWTYGHEAAGEQIARRVLARLKADRETSAAVSLLVAHHGDVPALTRAQALSWLHDFGRENAFRLLEVKRCDLLGRIQGRRTKLFVQELVEFEAILKDAAETGCWKLEQLALTGADMVAAGFSPGSQIGKTRKQLLERVMAGELPNEKSALLNAAILMK